MCLAHVDCVFKIPKPEVKYGYKLFIEKNFFGKDKMLVGQFYGLEKPRPMGMWMHERDYRSNRRRRLIYLNIGTFDKEGIVSYPIGWHIYKNMPKNLTSKITFPLYKVAYRNVVAEGWQDGKRVVVCKEMKIIKKVKLEDIIDY